MTPPLGCARMPKHGQRGADHQHQTNAQWLGHKKLIIDDSRRDDRATRCAAGGASSCICAARSMAGGLGPGSYAACFTASIKVGSLVSAFERVYAKRGSAPNSLMFRKDRAASKSGALAP